MERDRVEAGTTRAAAELRIQLAQMTAASQVLEWCAWDEKSKGYLATMNQGICRMLRIVNRMELEERLSGESPRLNLAATDLGALTADLGDKMEGLLERAGVRLTVEGPEHLPARTDGELIRQMLLELVANGAKAGSRVAVRLSLDRGNAVFTVEDDGPGIGQDKLAGLFGGEQEEQPDWKRSGNGVAIARQIAVLHGGTLVARCAPGKGLKVTASIPAGLGGDGSMESPKGGWDRGGFDEALVGLSHLLPVEAFAPGEYE